MTCKKIENNGKAGRKKEAFFLRKKFFPNLSFFLFIQLFSAYRRSSTNSLDQKFQFFEGTLLHIFKKVASTNLSLPKRVRSSFVCSGGDLRNKHIKKSTLGSLYVFASYACNSSARNVAWRWQWRHYLILVIYEGCWLLPFYIRLSILSIQLGLTSCLCMSLFLSFLFSDS